MKYSNLKIGQKLNLLTSLLIVCSMAGFFFYTRSITLKQARENARVICGEYAEHYGLYVRQMFMTALGETSAMADAMEAQAASENPSRELATAMLKRWYQRGRKQSRLYDTWVTFEPGAFDERDLEFAGSKKYGKTGQYSAWVLEDEVYDCLKTGDAKTDIWYDGPEKRGKITVSDFFDYEYPDGTQTVVAISVPLLDPSGRHIGVLGCDFEVGSIHEAIRPVRVYENGYLTLLSEGGGIVSTRDEKGLKQNLSYFPWMTQEVREKMAEGRNFDFSYDSALPGEKMFASMVPLELGNSGNVWYIIASVPFSEITHHAHRMLRNVLFLAVALIVLMIFILNLISRSIAGPLKKAVRFANEIARGNLELSRLESPRKDEIGSLAEALNNMKENLSTLNHAIDQASESILLISAEGVVQFANPSTFSIMDLTANDVVGKPFPPGKVGQSRVGEFKNALCDDSGWSGRLSGTRRDGSSYVLDYSVSAVFGPSGKLMCYLGVGRDTTQELFMQAQLQQGQKMEAIGTLAGGIAHDFNNILGAIFGYTELALNDLEDKEGLEEFLNEILGSARRARDLVRHILAFSRKSDMDQKPISPRFVVKEAVKLLRASLPSSIDIQLSLNSHAMVYGNVTQIHQVIMNLATNAGYAMRDGGGVLNISLDEIEDNSEFHSRYPELPSGNLVRITVSDTGHGIPVEVLERIFDPFFTTKPVGEGTGLGLSVVHGIVKSFGGEIIVESEVQKGTTFYVLIPILDVELFDVTEKEGLGDLSGGQERILVVDDEISIAQTSKFMLEKMGYRVQSFSCSSSAWEAFSSDPDAFDLILTDYTMPRMLGTALSEKVRTLRKDIPIILTSGNLSITEDIDALHPISLLKKPAASVEIAEAVRKALDVL